MDRSQQFGHSGRSLSDETLTVLRTMTDEVLILEATEIHPRGNAIHCFQNFCRHEQLQRERVSQRFKEFAGFFQAEIDDHFAASESSIMGTTSGYEESIAIAEELASRLNGKSVEKTSAALRMKNLVTVHAAFSQIGRNIAELGEVIGEGDESKIHPALIFKLQENCERGDVQNLPPNLAMLGGQLAMLPHGEKWRAIFDIY